MSGGRRGRCGGGDRRLPVLLADSLTPGLGGLLDLGAPGLSFDLQASRLRLDLGRTYVCPLLDLRLGYGAHGRCQGAGARYHLGQVDERIALCVRVELSDSVDVLMDSWAGGWVVSRCWFRLA